MQDFLQKQSLILMQSLLGVISPNFRMVSIKGKSDKLIITITLETENEEDFNEIEDLHSEFEALQEHEIEYEILVNITNEKLVWPDHNSRVIFKKREMLIK